MLNLQCNTARLELVSYVLDQSWVPVHVLDHSCAIFGPLFKLSTSTFYCTTMARLAAANHASTIPGSQLLSSSTSASLSLFRPFFRSNPAGIDLPGRRQRPGEGALSSTLNFSKPTIKVVVPCHFALLILSSLISSNRMAQKD